LKVFVDVITHAALRNHAYEYFSNYQTQLFGKSLSPEYELSAHGWMGDDRVQRVYSLMCTPTCICSPTWV